MQLKHVIIIIIIFAPVGLTCAVVFLSGVIRIATVLLIFLFGAGLCKGACARARLRRLQHEQEQEGDRSMAALSREPAVELGRAAISGLPVYKYEKMVCGGGEIDQCAVCLAEIRPEEVVKQLPVCTHLFHEGCIDVWLCSHRTCPVCRSQLVEASVVPAVEVAARALQSV